MRRSVFLALALAWAPSAALGAPADSTVVVVEELSRYDRFGGLAGILPASFEYPKDWRILPGETDEGVPYTQILILGPRNLDNTFTSTLVIRRSPAAAAGGTDADSRALLERYKRELFNDSQVVREITRQVGGRQAVDLTVTYTIPAPAHHDRSILRQPIRVYVRTVYLDEAGHIYEIVYTSDERNFPAYQDNFEHLLESLRFSADVSS